MLWYLFIFSLSQHCVTKFLKRSELDWSVVWTITLNYVAIFALRLDENAIIILSIDGIVDKLCEEKSSPVLKAISSSKR